MLPSGQSRVGPRFASRPICGVRPMPGNGSSLRPSPPKPAWPERPGIAGRHRLDSRAEEAVAVALVPERRLLGDADVVHVVLLLRDPGQDRLLLLVGLRPVLERDPVGGGVGLEPSDARLRVGRERRLREEGRPRLRRDAVLDDGVGAPVFGREQEHGAKPNDPGIPAPRSRGSCCSRRRRGEEVDGGLAVRAGNVEQPVRRLVPRCRSSPGSRSRRCGGSSGRCPDTGCGTRCGASGRRSRPAGRAGGSSCPARSGRGRTSRPRVRSPRRRRRRSRRPRRVSWMRFGLMPVPPRVEWTSSWFGFPSMAMYCARTPSGWPFSPVAVGG